MNCALYFSMVFTTVKGHPLLLKATVTKHFYYVNVTSKFRQHLSKLTKITTSL